MTTKDSWKTVERADRVVIDSGSKYDGHRDVMYVAIMLAVLRAHYPTPTPCTEDGAYGSFRSMLTQEAQASVMIKRHNGRQVERWLDRAQCAAGKLRNVGWMTDSAGHWGLTAAGMWGDKSSWPGRQAPTPETPSESGFVYAVTSPKYPLGTFKIGLASDTDERMKAYRTHLSRAQMVFRRAVPNMRFAEDSLHTWFADRRDDGEHFDGLTLTEIEAAADALFGAGAGADALL